MRNNIIHTLLPAMAAAVLGAQAVHGQAPATPQGFITAKEYYGIGGVAVADLTGNAKYPNAADAIFYPKQFEWPTGADGRGGPAGQELDRPPGNVIDNYGVMIEGYFYPNRSGAHVFALAADDGADLFLSTDADPAKAVQIATEPQWNPVRAFGTSGDGRRPTVDSGTADERKSNLSKPISLTSGRPYYIRARMKEGGGGDNLAVAVGDSYASITDESLPIGGNQLSSIDRADVTLPYFGGLSGQANGFDFGVNDGQGKTVASATAKLNGTSVPVTLTTRGGSKFITYRIANVAQFLPSGSTHSVEAEMTDSAGGKQTRTASFTVGAYAALNPGHKVTSATQRGINHRVYQAEAGRPGGNARWAADDALNGYQIDPNTGQAFPNAADASGTGFADTVNWEQNGGDDGGQNFDSDSPANDPRPNAAIPGIGGAGTDNIAAEVWGFLELPAGLVRLGVNSDDGFRLSFAGGAPDQFGIQAGIFDGGRGASDSIFDIVVPEAGIYPYRLTWWEGGGGANVEWFSIDLNTGVRTLINDPATASAYKSYRTASGTKPAINSFYPANGSRGFPVNGTITIKLADGTVPVDPASLSLKVNGATVTLNRVTAGGVHTLTYKPATPMPFDTLINLEFSYAPQGGAAVMVASSFTTQGLAPDDLPVAGAFWIEAEDYNSNGVNPAAGASTMPYAGGAYDGVPAFINIDYLNNDGNDSDQYRTTAAGGTDTAASPECPDCRNVNMNDNINGRYGGRRPGADMTTNYKIGWVEGGSWQNYTRTIPAGWYNVYAALSFDGTAPGQLAGSLDRVTSDPKVANQTVQRIGSFNAPGSGGWGANNLVGMTDATGNKGFWKAPGGPVTLRFNLSSGDFDWFVLTRATDVPTIVQQVTPANGAIVAVGTPINIVLQDGSTAVQAAQVKLRYAGTDVTAQANPTKTGDTLTLAFTPAGQAAGTRYTYELEYPSLGKTEKLTVAYWTTPLGSPGMFLIEAEDFNYDGGQSQAAASTMPYTGGAYANLNATSGVDFSSNDTEASDGANQYRKITNGRKNINDNNGDVNRGTWSVGSNFKLGWSDSADWMNYTRTIPDGNYRVWAALSFGGGTDADQNRATLARVTAGASTPDQTLEQLGVFRGPGTGGWGANTLVPLTMDGAIKEVSLGGSTTLRVTLDSGDFDFLVLQRVGGAPASKVIAYSVNASGQLVLTFPAGTVLTSSGSLGGTYAPVAGAASPYTVNATGDAQFYKLQ